MFCEVIILLTPRHPFSRSLCVSGLRSPPPQTVPCRRVASARWSHGRVAHLGPGWVIPYWCRASFALRLCVADLVSPWRAGLFQANGEETGRGRRRGLRCPGCGTGKRKLLSQFLKRKRQGDDWPCPAHGATSHWFPGSDRGGSTPQGGSYSEGQQLAGGQEQQRGPSRWACRPSEGRPVGRPGAPGPQQSWVRSLENPCPHRTRTRPPVAALSATAETGSSRGVPWK